MSTVRGGSFSSFFSSFVSLSDNLLDLMLVDALICTDHEVEAEENHRNIMHVYVGLEVDIYTAFAESGY